MSEPSTNGKSCDRCGHWIAIGEFHTCPTANQPVYYRFNNDLPYMAVLERIADSLDKLVNYFVRNIR
jgi:hypothetical protein